MHTIGSRYIVTSSPRPNKAATDTLWGIIRKAWGYGAGEVIVAKQVDNDQETW